MQRQLQRFSNGTETEGLFFLKCHLNRVRDTIHAHRQTATTKLANKRITLGECHLLFMLGSPSQRVAKQTAKAVAKHKNELMLTQSSLSVCQLGDHVVRLGSLNHAAAILVSYSPLRRGRPRSLAFLNYTAATVPN